VTRRIPTVVLGGTGYVAGELLRLIAAHPHFELAGVLSESQPGEPIAGAFRHLSSAYPSECFQNLTRIEQLVADTPSAAIFSAAPHGSAAALIDRLLHRAESAGRSPHVVDISADFRFRTAAAYEAVYRHPHGAPARLDAFTCAVPEHLARAPTAHVAHPGCFATATLLAAVPLLARELTRGELFVSAVTGSTGSGRKPQEGTHHPSRHSDLYAYGGLSHRHTPEIHACAAAATGVSAQFAFVPHSGPFARGIHATVQAALRSPRDTDEVLAVLREFYAGAPFVRISDSPPHVKDVATSNYATLSATSDGTTLAVFCVLDNLNKGAAGGAVQWMNRLYEIPETCGLTAPAPGWT
jgi:N-acetyl-gamma-glutamyl-phosphate reductase common form